MKIRPILLTVILLAGTNASLMAAGCCKCIPIKQKCKNNIPTPTVFTITNSGNYALKGDFKGSIVIKASDVTLDLCSFKVIGTGGATTPAIVAAGNNITIRNGSVTNPSGLGIEIIGSTGLLIENLDVYGSNQALFLLGCKSSQVNFLNAYQNNNTLIAVVFLRGCESIELNSVKANNNTKLLTASNSVKTNNKTKLLKASIGTNDPGVGIISVFDSFNIALKDCSANFNTRGNDNSLFAPLAALFSKSVTFINCQANDNNIDIDLDTNGFAPIYLQGCLDTVLDGVQANRNNLRATEAFLRAIFSLGSSRTIIKNSQANDNIVDVLNNPSATSTDNQDLSAIMVFGLPSTPLLESSDIVISHCQVSGNVVNDGSGPIGRLKNLGILNGIYILGNSDSPATVNFDNRSVIEYSQVNDNKMNSTNIQELVVGINIAASEDLSIGNSSANGNNGNFVLGIAVNSGPNAFHVGSFLNHAVTGTIGACRNIKIVKSTANDNKGNLLSCGIAFLGLPQSTTTPPVLATPIQNCEISDCQASSNGVDNGFGILLRVVQGCSVIDCQTDNNAEGLSASGVHSNPLTLAFINTDCSILNCSAKENIFGFRLLGQNDHFLLKDNIAIGNLGFGFQDASTTLTSRYLGNYADNGVGKNYFFNISPAPIQIFTLNPNGTYTNFSGDPGHFSALINVQAQ